MAVIVFIIKLHLLSNDANENVEVKIWDITILVKTMDNGVSNAIPWYGTNEKEEAVESGVYIYQVKAGNKYNRQRHNNSSKIVIVVADLSA